MANITEAATYDAAVPQLETTTAATGGAGGAMNSQAQALANRTKYIKAILDSPSLLAALVQDASTSAKGVVQLASTGIESATKVPKALGADLVALITAAGYTLNPATGTASLDGIADGTTYKRVLAAIATALNAGTYDAASVSEHGIGGYKALIQPDNNDCDNLIVPGIYGMYLGGTGTQTHFPAPAFTDAVCVILVLADSPAGVIQIGAFHYGSGWRGRIFIRNLVTTWSPWYELWTSYSDGNGGQPPSAKSNQTSSATIGWFAAVDCASGAAVTLPSGGTFEWFVTTYGATYNSIKSGISAGGAMTGTASANLTMYYKRLTA